MKQKCFSLKKTCFWRPWEGNLSWLQTDKRLSAEEASGQCHPQESCDRHTHTVPCLTGHRHPAQHSHQEHWALQHFYRISKTGADISPGSWLLHQSIRWNTYWINQKSEQFAQGTNPHTLKNSWQHCLSTCSNTNFKELTWAVPYIYHLW